MDMVPFKQIQFDDFDDGVLTSVNAARGIGAWLTAAEDLKTASLNESGAAPLAHIYWRYIGTFDRAIYSLAQTFDDGRDMRLFCAKPQSIQGEAIEKLSRRGLGTIGL